MGSSPSPGLREDSLPSLTVDVSAHQGLFHLGWSKGEANEEQDVLEAPSIHLTRTIEDIEIASEGCQGRQLLSGTTLHHHHHRHRRYCFLPLQLCLWHVVYVWCARYVHTCGGRQVASCLYCPFYSLGSVKHSGKSKERSCRGQEGSRPLEGVGVGLYTSILVTGRHEGVGSGRIGSTGTSPRTGDEHFSDLLG